MGGPQALVMITAGVGDAVLAVPALRALRSALSDREITLLTTPGCRGLFHGCPFVNRVETLDVGRLRFFRNLLGAWGWSETIRTVRRLRAQRFEEAINLYGIGSFSGALRMALFLAAIRPKKSIGRQGRWPIPAFDLAVRSHGHEIEAQAAVAEALGGKVEKTLDLWLSEEECHQGEEFLKKFGWTLDRSLILFHPGSAVPVRCWPIERFAQVADYAAGRGFLVGIVGAGAKPLGERMRARMKEPAIDLWNRTSLRLLATIIRRARLLVTNDSGPMHIAAALGTPLIGIFGSPDPRYAPIYPWGPAERRRILEAPSGEGVGGVSLRQVQNAIDERR